MMYIFKEDMKVGTPILCWTLSVNRRTVWQRCKDGKIPHTVDATGHLVFTFNRELRGFLLEQGCSLLRMFEVAGSESDERTQNRFSAPVVFADIDDTHWLVWPPTELVSFEPSTAL